MRNAHGHVTDRHNGQSMSWRRGVGSMTIAGSKVQPEAIKPLFRLGYI